MKILVLTQKHSGVGYHRLIMPVLLMEGLTKVRITDTLTDGIWEEGWDIVFLNRTFDNANIFELRKQHGFKVVVDVDDYWILDHHHLLYEGYMAAHYPTAVVNHLRQADLVTCTHERLAERVKDCTDKILIVPNCIPYGKFQFTDERQETDFVKFFWAGGITHKEDLKLLKNPIATIDPQGVHFVLGGFADSNETERAYWWPMADYFTNYGKHPNTILRGRPVEEYYAMYSVADVAMIPLQKSMFNQYKSNLKILEAAGKKIPVIVSRVHPYIGFPEELVNYASNPVEWLRHMETLRDNPELRKEQGEALYQYCVEHYNFDEVNQRRAAAFQALT